MARTIGSAALSTVDEASAMVGNWWVRGYADDVFVASSVHCWREDVMTSYCFQACRQQTSGKKRRAKLGAFGGDANVSLKETISDHPAALVQRSLQRLQTVSPPISHFVSISDLQSSQKIKNVGASLSSHTLVFPHLLPCWNPARHGAVFKGFERCFGLEDGNVRPTVFEDGNCDVGDER